MKFRTHNPLILVVSLFCISFTAFSQRNCGTMEALELMLQKDPSLKQKMEKLENYSNKLQSISVNNEIGVLTIPVVVHVIYNTAAENISDAQIASQILVLNQDFRRTNSDADNTWSQAADSEIQFVLASVDPSGNATNGITRTSTNSTSFSTNDLMKSAGSGGHDAWPNGSYLNIWVCDIAGGILGYAQFPGGPASTDGVVIDYQYTGTQGTATSPFDLGRTATHEVGHWLNLRHIWGDGGCGVDDSVLDTPESDGPNYSCPVGVVSCGTVDMVQNYMDYSDDLCMNLFTLDQKTRMRALFQPGGFRESIINAAVIPVEPEPYVCDSNALVLTINFDSYPTETAWNIMDEYGAIVASKESYPSSLIGQSITENICLTDGTYTFNMLDSFGDGICCSYGTGDYSLTVFSKTLVSSNGIFNYQESNQLILNDQYFKFIGPGTEWEADNNWNKELIPPPSYSGLITITSGCNKLGGIELTPPNQIIVSPTAFFSITGDSASER